MIKHTHDRINVLLLILNLKVGGLEHLVLDIAAKTNRDRYKTIICCIEKSIELAMFKKVQDSGIEVFVIKRSYKTVPRLIKLLKTKQIDILHTHNSVSHLVGCFAGKLAKIPCIVHTKHGNGIPYENKLYGPLLRYLLGKLTDVFVCVSEDVFRHAAKYYRIDKNKLCKIINGVDLTRFGSIEKKLFQKASPLVDEKVICTVGRLSEEKSHETLLEAFSIVSKDVKNAKLFIVGDGVRKDYLIDITERFSIEDRVVFMGARTDVSVILEKSDLFVLPSLTEGISLTLLEAMAAGKPTVATAVGGNPEVVVHGETGFLVPPKEPEKLAEAITKLLLDSDLASSMGKLGRKRIEEKFNLDSMIKEYEELYEKCLNNKGVDLYSKQRILVFTNAFPRKFYHNKGIAVKKEIEWLQKDFDIKIIAPIPHNLFAGRNGNAPDIIWVNDIEVYQPRYYTIPKIGALFSGYSYYFAVKKMVEELQKQFRFNLILSYWTYPDGFAASLCASRFKVPFIVRPRGSDINAFLNYGLLRNSIKAVLKKADKIIPKSKDLEDNIKELGIGADKVSYIPNGVSLDDFRPLDKEECRRALNMPLDRKMILFVGNLLPIKGVSCLLEVIKVLDARKRGDLMFKILGSGKMENEVRRVIKKLKFISVALEGETPHKDLPIWINASDLVCITSVNEGCPNILLESLACGKPVVATKVGGIPEIIDSNMLGILIPANDAYAAADAIEEALKKDWKKEYLRNKVSGQSWDKFSAQLKEECLALTGGVNQ